MGFFSNLFSPKGEIEKYIEYLEVGSDEEIGTIIALSTIARRILIEQNESLGIMYSHTQKEMNY